jgi:phenylacetic acid degradation operon negative regulatory protein
MSQQEPHVSRIATAGPRVWSLIVTIIGDLLMDEGRDLTPEPLPLPALSGLLALFGIDAQLARTNLSRLVAAGTLTRVKSGRHTYYSLSPASAGVFAAAAEVIYARRLPVPTGRIEALAIDRCDARQTLRERLAGEGWRAQGPNFLLRPEHDGRLSAVPEAAIHLLSGRTPTLEATLPELWGLAGLAGEYGAFAAGAPTPESLAQLDAAAALRTRLGLVHHFRRLVLRDPFLPDWALPEGWTGPAARSAFDRALGTLRRRGIRGVDLLQNS